MSKDTDIHSCSYFCHIPACIKAQRDELRQKLEAALDVVVDLGGEVRVPEMEEARQRRRDVERLDWLASRMLAADFDYGGDGTQVLVFEMPRGFRVSADCRATIDAARGQP